MSDEEEEDVNDMLNEKNDLLDYGSVVFINYLDLNGQIYFAYSRDIKSQRIVLSPAHQFLQSGRSQRGLFKILPRFLVNDYVQAKGKYQDMAGSKTEADFGWRQAMRENNLEAGSLLKDMYDELDDNFEILKRNNS